jgi:hypothetical protein
VINAQDAFNQALELFSSLFTDMAPSDLPAGLSPANQDISYLPGQVATRPALQRDSAAAPDSTNQVSLAEYAAPSGDCFAMRLYSSGNLFSQDEATLVFTKIASVIPGSQFRSVTAFDKQFFAFFNQAVSEAFTDSPFAGADVPRYYDGKNVWRVTQDAPAIQPAFSNIPTQAVALAQSAPTGTVTITAVVSSGKQTITVPGNPGFPPRIPPTPPTTVTYYTTLTFTCSGAVPATWAGSQITVTGCTGTGSNYANATGVIQSVSGTTFVLGVGSGTEFVNLSGQSGTGTLAGNYFIRTGNNVTAYTNGAPANFFPGLYAQILNADGSQINGPSWTIDTTGGIKRDATGLVTITIDTQLTNLASGTVLYINATDTTDFPAGFQTVYQVISATGGKTTFTVSNPTWGNGAIVTSNAGGSVYQQWSGTFQILTTGVDSNGNNFFTYFQLGPDATVNTTGGTPQAQIQSQMPPGPRSAVLIFESVNGAQTAPSIPVQLSVVGGTNLLQASNLAIGPAGTARRILAFTPAYGASWFYVSPALVPSAAGLSQVLSIGTIINDNTSVSAIVDFSDAQLVAGTEIDIQGNNLFAQIVLAPCLGCIEYQGRMGWWGEINNIKNLPNNQAFDGGYTPISGIVSTSGFTVTLTTGSEWINIFGIPVATGATIYIAGVPYIIAGVSSGTVLTTTTSVGTQTGVPFYILSPNGGAIPGWTATNAYLMPQADQSLGFAAVMVASTGGGAELAQSCYQDIDGAPIIEPLTAYTFRCLASVVPGSATTMQISIELYSPTLGVLALGTLSVLPTTQSWITIPLEVLISPANIPSDVTRTIIFETNASSGTPSSLTIDETQLIPTLQPVLFQQMRLSYFDNEFGYDEETGLIGLDGSAKITAAFKQRGYLYALTDGPMAQTQNNGSTEPNNWGFPDYADACDCFGPNAVDTTEDVAWWAGKTGLRLFLGSQPKKISQEIQPAWQAINQAAPTAVWVCDDPIERLVYIGVPVNGSLIANQNYPMSYRSVDAVYNVPDPLHTSYSGKLIATDLCRKWTIWNTPMICGCLLTRPGLQSQMFFGGPSGAGYSGNIYSLNAAKYTDDDFGQIFSYYVTYFFFNHDIEQNSPQLGMHLKIDTYLSAYVTGVGQIQPLVLANNLNNPWLVTSTVWDAVNLQWIESGTGFNPLASIPLINGVLKNDLEWGLNVNGISRIAIKWAAVPLAGQTDAAFALTHMTLAAREATIAVRGANQ